MDVIDNEALLDDIAPRYSQISWKKFLQRISIHVEIELIDRIHSCLGGKLKEYKCLRRARKFQYSFLEVSRV